jgi:enoyl-CoA hydratase
VRSNLREYSTMRGTFGTLPEADSMSTYETIEVEREGPVAVVRLNRPKVLNALNVLMIHELRDVLEELEADAAVRVAILTGAGERAFAAGADIAELNSLSNLREAHDFIRFGQGVTLAMERARFPIIAAVNGFALGGGCELAMACDMRIAADTAKFGQPEVNLGLMPGYGGTQRTTRLVGRGMAMYLCLTGETIGADEALRAGLVEKVVPAAELMNEARRIAKLIAERAPLAIAATKRTIEGGAALSVASGLEIEALNFASLIETADFREGTKAFLEKRRAEFSGR